MRLKNQSNCVAKLSLYDLVTKKNTVSSSLDEPGELWAKGLTDYGAVGVTTVGFTPFRSPEFNQYFGVNRVTTVSMEPGQQHDHVVYQLYNRVLDSIQFENNVGTSIAGVTRFLLVVFHGSLGHESASASTVSYMPVTFDYAWSSEYTYGWIEKSARGFTATDANPTTIVDMDFMGENGDVDANIVTA